MGALSNSKASCCLMEQEQPGAVSVQPPPEPLTTAALNLLQLQIQGYMSSMLAARWRQRRGDLQP